MTVAEGVADAIAGQYSSELRGRRTILILAHVERDVGETERIRIAMTIAVAIS